ncbi:MAG: OmpA family protein [Alphaproteobacteria bacterium]|nr:OmpA family protein [Alphaproteobacteria bacterium]
MLFTLMLASVAMAQDTVSAGEVPELNAQLFRPTIDGRHTLWTDDAYVEPNAYTSGRVLLQYVNDPMVYEFSDGTRTELVSNLMQLDLMAAHTRGRFRFGAYVPVYLRSTGEATSGETGLGDIAVDVKANLLNHDDAPVGLALNGRLMLPTATVAAPLGGGGLGYELAVVADVPITESFLLAANLGTRGVPEVKLENVEWDDQLFLRVGAGYAINPNAGVSLDLNSNFTYANISNTAALPVEALLGGYSRLGSSNLVIRGGAGTGLTGGIGAPKFRALVGISYEPPREGDDDLDGILNSVDACPDVAEDADGYMDEDGCPEPTQVTIKFVDEDGQPIKAAQFKMGESSGAHGDTLELDAGSYSLDATATDYEPLSGFAATVPEGPPTTIKAEMLIIRGVVNIKVIDPEGKPIEGAKWAVDNKDMGPLPTGVGAADVKPGPHTVAAEADGYLKTSQKVKVVSGETIEVTLTPKPSTVKVSQAKIDLGDSVYFETNKAIIKPESFGLLDDVATVMKEYPQITLVRIEGHTDSRGSDEANQTLSENRAAAVRDYLISKGVEANRLESAGYGESKPLVEGNNEAAWSKNRRVDFFIKSRSDGLVEATRRRRSSSPGLP